jgi:dolichol-phosphate mannosyltransferase
MAEPEDIQISVVVPAYNEDESVPPLVREIAAAVRPLARSFEIIVVDDGSTDRTVEVTAALAPEFPELRALRHARNCGQSAGMATGFASARGGVIVTLDADGQNDPADIPKLLAALGDAVDCVCGVRTVRRDSFVKRASSKIANRFRGAIIGDRVTDAGCAFRAIRKRALREMIVFNGMHRFLPTILQIQGYRVVEIPVNHRPRALGKSKYGINNRLWRGIRDCFALRWYRARAIPGRRLRDE